jgi:hypothetical protein
MPNRRDRLSIRAQLEANYHLIACDLVRNQLASMQVIYALFGGDFEAFYILAVIAHRSVDHPAFKETPLAAWTGDETKAMPSLTTNVRSIAQSTGIPEETVRRKVMLLVSRGWVQREGNRLSYTAKGAQQLAPVRQALLDRAAQDYRVISATL